jgi:hypothetical protein
VIFALLVTLDRLALLMIGEFRYAPELDGPIGFNGPRVDQARLKARHHHHVGGSEGRVVEHLAKLNTPLSQKLPTPRRSSRRTIIGTPPQLSRQPTSTPYRAMRLDLSDEGAALSFNGQHR